MCTVTCPQPASRPLGPVARLHLARTLRSTPRQAYNWQVLRSYVGGTGEVRVAQLMAGTQPDCVAGAARWAQATGEAVVVVANTAEAPRGVWAFPPTT